MAQSFILFVGLVLLLQQSLASAIPSPLTERAACPICPGTERHNAHVSLCPPNSSHASSLTALSASSMTSSPHPRASRTHSMFPRLRTRSSTTPVSWSSPCLPSAPWSSAACPITPSSTLCRRWPVTRLPSQETIRVPKSSTSPTDRSTSGASLRLLSKAMQVRPSLVPYR